MGFAILDARKFKHRGELLGFAAKHTGALAAYGFAQCLKSSHRVPTKTEDLRSASLTDYDNKYPMAEIDFWRERSSKGSDRASCNSATEAP